MLTDKLKELAQLRTTMATLEAQVAAERNQELAGLPAAYGFDNAGDFIAAVRAAAGTGPARRGRRPGTANKAAAATGKKGRRRRAVITDATRAEVKKLVGAGKTGGEIAKTLKISLPSVQNIKKALGLTRKG